MDAPRTPDKKLFREWFLEEYDVGIFDDAAYRECIAFLIGMALSTEGEAHAHLSRCIDALRASRAFIEVSSRCKVVLP
jgi:hypothetical protein